MLGKAQSRDESRCRFCGEKLSLIQRLAKAEFCNNQHRDLYQKQQDELAIERLQQFRLPERTPVPPAAAVEGLWPEEEDAAPVQAEAPDPIPAVEGPPLCPSITAGWESRGPRRPSGTDSRAEPVEPRRRIPSVSYNTGGARLALGNGTSGFVSWLVPQPGDSGRPYRIEPSHSSPEQLKFPATRPHPFRWDEIVERERRARQGIPPMAGLIPIAGPQTLRFQSRIAVPAPSPQHPVVAPVKVARPSHPGGAAPRLAGTMRGGTWRIRLGNEGSIKPYWEPAVEEMFASAEWTTRYPVYRAASPWEAEGFEDKFGLGPGAGRGLGDGAAEPGGGAGAGGLGPGDTGGSLGWMPGLGFGEGEGIGWGVGGQGGLGLGSGFGSGIGSPDSYAAGDSGSGAVGGGPEVGVRAGSESGSSAGNADASSSGPGFEAGPGAGLGAGMDPGGESAGGGSGSGGGSGNAGVDVSRVLALVARSAPGVTNRPVPPAALTGRLLAGTTLPARIAPATGAASLRLHNALFWRGLNESCARRLPSAGPAWKWARTVLDPYSGRQDREVIAAQSGIPSPKVLLLWSSGVNGIGPSGLPDLGAHRPYPDSGWVDAKALSQRLHAVELECAGPVLDPARIPAASLTAVGPGPLRHAPVTPYPDDGWVETRVAAPLLRRVEAIAAGPAVAAPQAPPRQTDPVRGFRLRVSGCQIFAPGWVAERTMPGTWRASEIEAATPDVQQRLAAPEHSRLNLRARRAYRPAVPRPKEQVSWQVAVCATPVSPWFRPAECAFAGPAEEGMLNGAP